MLPKLMLVMVFLGSGFSLAHPMVRISTTVTLSEQDVKDSLAKLDDILGQLKKSEGEKYNEYRGTYGGGVLLSENRGAYCQNRPRLTDLKPTFIRSEECMVQKKTVDKDVNFAFSFSFVREHLQSMKAALEKGDPNTNIQLKFSSVSLLTGATNSSENIARCHSVKLAKETKKYCDVDVEVNIPESADL
jgi:hypothetical protein